MNKFFPLIEHLYIYQLFEYHPGDFLKWFYKYPFRRNLQRKGKIEWSTKAKLIFGISLFLILFFAFTATITQTNSIIFFPLFFLLYFFFSPFFILFAHGIIYPLEQYQKSRIVALAKNKLSKMPNLKVVAICGSFAKTSTKNMLYTLLWKDFRVVKTPKSFNTELGIARTILSDIKENTEVFIAEMDAYKRGEIKKLAQIVNPKYGVITSVAPQHLERFGSMEDLALTQFELAENLGEGGVLFLNSSNDWINKLESKYNVKKIYYGNGAKSNFSVKNIDTGINGTRFSLSVNILSLANQNLHIKLKAAGETNAQNFTGAAAVALELGLSIGQIEKRAGLIKPTEHRLEIRNSGEISLIDNTYNTNPITSKFSLKLLDQSKAKEKIVITPGFVELGKEFETENSALGEKIAKVADWVVVVGENAKEAITKGLKRTNFPMAKVFYKDTTNHALEFVYKRAKTGAVVLLENDLPDQYF